MGIVKKAWEIWEHPDELVPMIRMYWATQQIKRLPKDPDLAFCYDILNKVSRSFAVVIQQLPESLRDAVCVFYLVLRALDTVEDDMGIPVDEKCPILKDFHSMIYSLETRYSYGEGEYRRLLKNFPKVVTVFKGLSKSQQDVIADITRRMGAGMAKFIEKEVETIAEYDEYCHYVAGLVGVGLSKLFSSSGVESPEFEQLDDLSNHMGLFLQKTNIIRDYLEDIMEEPAPRMFWPKEVWGPHAQSLDGFKEAENRDAAVRCLNHMVTNALRHAPFCLQYLSRLRHPMVFRFCAIPQIMAMRTLMMCYNNPTVFTGVVKMRRGETCKIFDILTKMQQVYGMFWDAASLMAVDAQVKASGDPVLKQTLAALDAIEAACEAGLKACAGGPKRLQDAADEPIEWWVRLGMVFLTGGYAGYAWNVDSLRAGQGVMHRESVFNVLLDHFQRFLSLVLLVAALVIAFRGKKL